MSRTYKVIDADGHILEPVDIWDRYMDPAYRERAPRMVLDDNGKERLLIEGQILGNPKGLGRLGAVGARDGTVPADGVLDLADPPRDPERTPFPWTRGGSEWQSPWLPLGDTSRNAEDSTILPYARELIARRKELGDGYRTLKSAKGVWAYARGEQTCVLNMSDDVADHDGHVLEPWQGVVL